MKVKTAKTLVLFVAAITVVLTFIQPTVIHQLVVWVSGLFAVVTCLALFVIASAPKTTTAKPAPDFLTEAQVIVMRQHKCSDEYIAKTLGISVETVKGMGV